MQTKKEHCVQAQYLRTSVCVFGASMQTQHSLSSADATAAAGRGAEEAVLAFFVHLSAAVGAATARLAGVAVLVVRAAAVVLPCPRRPPRGGRTGIPPPRCAFESISEY